MLGSTISYSQDLTSYKDIMLGRWVRYSGYREDTVVYIPYNSALTENISNELRYAGITFNRDYSYFQHLFKMCGNDDRPDFYTCSWNLKKLDATYELIMTDVDKRIKKYTVIELDKDKLVLIPGL